MKLKSNEKWKENGEIKAEEEEKINSLRNVQLFQMKGENIWCNKWKIFFKGIMGRKKNLEESIFEFPIS